MVDSGVRVKEEIFTIWINVIARMVLAGGQGTSILR